MPVNTRWQTAGLSPLIKVSKKNRRDNIVLFDLQEGVLGNSEVWQRH